jgi:hypothetical protein
LADEVQSQSVWPYFFEWPPAQFACVNFRTGQGKIFIRDMSGLLGEVVGSFEIPAKEPDLAVYILF